MPRIFWPATLSLAEHGVKSIRERSQDEEKRWRLEGVEGWKRRGGSLISPDKKPCRCCVRRRSPPKNSAHVLERAALGAGCAEGTGGQDHPKRGPQWELVCHETPVLCLAFLPAPIPAGAGPGGTGEGLGRSCLTASSCLPPAPGSRMGAKGGRLYLLLHLEADSSLWANVFLQWAELTSW